MFQLARRRRAQARTAIQYFVSMKKRLRILDSKGFTLAELLVVMLLWGVLLSCIVPAAKLGVELTQDCFSQILLQREARFLIDAISRDVMQASYVESPDATHLKLYLKYQAEKPCTNVSYFFDQSMLLLRREQNGGGAQPVSSGAGAVRTLPLRQCAFSLVRGGGIVNVRVQLTVQDGPRLLSLETQVSSCNGWGREHGL
ncbi:prepilin-type N-terminal cleavage/methylation domain-containing protein [Anaeromusa acidaminophila]|uniref:prepilin-type N-terminal cleavage/methylation domain-containing protein n=1 Tax=Anaeromusa acidaminophila TaxID=81464 RepID=UPI0009FF2AEC|nr:prepilin-type N-terminal cleavage/methylation domain-containing protein [Anaeromusa acidaminophila]